MFILNENETAEALDEADEAVSPSARKRMHVDPEMCLRTTFKRTDGAMLNDWAHPMTSVPSVLTFIVEDEAEKMDRTGQVFAISENNPFRMLWAPLITILLLYTATLFMYRIVFLDMKMPEPIRASDEWKSFDEFVNIVFWIDLIVNFFFTYNTATGLRVTSLPLIAKNYLCTSFAINLIACVPPSLIEMVVDTEGGEDDQSGIQSTVRIARLQRASRLVRLFRLTRVIKLNNLFSSEGVLKKMQELRGVRIVNYFFALGFACHVMACGWYLCAILHDNPQDTWVARRTVGPADDPEALLDRDSMDHYLTACYFVLTVFTTVGFGDMSAFSNGEICYVILVMLVGAVVHSIIVSEVITLVTSVDRTASFINEQKNLIEAYAVHAEMELETAASIKDYLNLHASTWISHRFDRDAMKHMITGRYLPSAMIRDLPMALYEGKLMQNMFFLPPGVGDNVPPRLPLMMALYLHKAYFIAGEVVYQRDDYAFNLFIVFKGTFAYVARPSPSGGIDDQDMQVPRLKVRQEPVPGSPPIQGPTGSVRRVGSVAVGAFELLDKANKAVVSAMGQGDGESPFTAIETVTKLFPYRLYGAGSYFGDIETIYQRTRFATARCEQDGEVMVLHRGDLKALTDTFPQFGHAWAAAAKHREFLRTRGLQRLTKAHPFNDLAAIVIQRSVREMLSKRALTPAAATSPGTSMRRGTKSFGVSITKASSSLHDHMLGDEGDFGAPARVAKADAVSGDLAKDVAEIKGSIKGMLQEMRSMRSEMVRLRERDQFAVGVL